MVKLFLFSSCSVHLLALSKKLALPNITTRTLCSIPTTMSLNLQSHAFAGNPLRSKTPKPSDPFSPTQALETLKTQLLDNPHLPSSSPSFKVLPFRKGRPLASTSGGIIDVKPNWYLCWISLADCKGLLSNCGVELSGDSLVYLGSRAEEDVVYWAVDVSKEDGVVPELGGRQLCLLSSGHLWWLLIGLMRGLWQSWLLLAMPGLCLNGIVLHCFVDIVEKRRSPRKLGDESSVLVSCAESESTLVLIRLS